MKTFKDVLQEVESVKGITINEAIEDMKMRLLNLKTEEFNLRRRIEEMEKGFCQDRRKEFQERYNEVYTQMWALDRRIRKAMVTV